MLSSLHCRLRRLVCCIAAGLVVAALSTHTFFSPGSGCVNWWVAVLISLLSIAGNSGGNVLPSVTSALCTPVGFHSLGICRLLLRPGHRLWHLGVPSSVAIRGHWCTPRFLRWRLVGVSGLHVVRAVGRALALLLIFICFVGPLQ